jgi:hypothetical protein
MSHLARAVLGSSRWTYRHADDELCIYPWTTVPGSDRCIFVYQDLPFAVQTVSRVTTDDRTGNQAVSDATYDFGRFNHGLEVAWDREFRGFGRTRKYSPTTEYTHPTTGLLVKFSTLEETQFYQEAFLRGQPARTVLYELPNGDRPQFPDRILELTVPEFGLAHGGSSNWAVFMTVFSGVGCDPSSGYLSDPNSCPPVGTNKQAYIAFGAAFAEPSLPYDDFIAAFANAEDRDRNDAFLVLLIRAHAARRPVAAHAAHELPLVPMARSCGERPTTGTWEGANRRPGSDIKISR